MTQFTQFHFGDMKQVQNEIKKKIYETQINLRAAEEPDELKLPVRTELCVLSLITSSLFASQSCPKT